MGRALGPVMFRGMCMCAHGECDHISGSGRKLMLCVCVCVCVRGHSALASPLGQTPDMIRGQREWRCLHRAEEAHNRELSPEVKPTSSSLSTGSSDICTLCWVCVLEAGGWTCFHDFVEWELNKKKTIQYTPSLMWISLYLDMAKVLSLGGASQ